MSLTTRGTAAGMVVTRWNDVGQTQDDLFMVSHARVAWVKHGSSLLSDWTPPSDDLMNHRPFPARTRMMDSDQYKQRSKCKLLL